MSSTTRAWLLHLYRIGIGLSGIVLLIILARTIPWAEAGISLALFTLFSLIIKRAGFHIAPGVTHSLVGVVDAAVLLIFGAPAGALVATASCLAYLLLRTWRHQTSATRTEMLEIALFSSGLKALIALGAGAIYHWAGGSVLAEINSRDIWPLLALFVVWFAFDHLGWGISEFIHGGLEQVWAFLRTVWSTSLLVEFFPLWATVIIVFVYHQGNMFVFWLLAAGLVAVSLVVQRLSDMWERLQDRLTELTALSEIGRAIVSAQLDEDDLCELIYEQASNIVDTSSFHLGLFDGPNYELKISIQEDVRQQAQRFEGVADEGIIGWMRRSRLPLLVRDFEREMISLPARPSYNSERPPRSGVYVPLIAGDKAIGTLSIQSAKPAAFTQDHLRLLSVIGNQAAMAIEKERMYQLEQRRARQLALIESVGRKVTSILDLDALFSQVVRLVQETFGYYHVSILSTATDSDEVRFEAGTAEHLLRADLRIPLGQGIVGWVAEQGEPLLVNDVQSDARFIHDQNLSDTRAELAVPLMVEERVLGVLDVQSDVHGAFDEDDLFILQTLASQVAIAVEDARLYVAQQEDAWMTTALLQVAEATSRLSNLSDVLSTVVRLTPILTGVDRCGILLWDKTTRTFVPTQAYGIDEAHHTRFVTLQLAEQNVPALVQACQRQEPVLLSGEAIKAALPRSMIEAFDLENLLVLPLLARGETLGAMVVDYVETNAPFTARKVDMIAGIANQAAIAIENAQLYAVQQEEVYVSTALLQVAEAVRSLTELDDILSTIVRIAPILIGVEQCAILIRSADAFSLVQSFGLDDLEAQDLADAFLNLNSELVQVLLKGRPALSTQTGSDIYALGDNVTLVTDDLAVLALPLIAKGNVLGVMAVDYVGIPIHFVDRWLNILNGIADQTAIAIENTRLYRQEAERQRLQRELQVAREIQASFLPQTYPLLPGWEMDAFWQSASQVGGDFYDMFMLPDGRLGLVIADVADKGVPAALFMALSRTLIRVVAQDILNPTEALVRTNDLIISDTHSDLFVTVFYVILDPQSGEIVYANGGHNPPLLVRRSGEVESLRARGIVLGIVSPIHLEEKRMRLEPGDLLLMYTDGITDAINENEEEFGTGHLADIVKQLRDRTPDQVIAEIYDRVMAFAGDMPQFDDFTLVVLKRAS
ncbi:MAG: GAF domain-containing protein [Anaerolineae bacterium]|nr:GAF domain-containing protein [Anaerolineae bacterium]